MTLRKTVARMFLWVIGITEANILIVCGADGENIRVSYNWSNIPLRIIDQRAFQTYVT